MTEKNFIGLKTKLTRELFAEKYEELGEGERLDIMVNIKELDFNSIALMLRNEGFEKLVLKSKAPKKGCRLITCYKGKKEPRLLSIIVPVYNEENTVGTLLDALINREYPIPVEFVIVESNSKDRTREIVKSYEGKPGVITVYEEKPSGKGNGVLLGIKHAHGNIIAIQDGDLEYDVNDYDKLLEPFKNDETLFVLGSRYKKDDWHMRKFSGSGRILADYLNLGQVLLTGILNKACGCHLTDPFTMYKIFDRDCMYGIVFEGGNFGLDWEIVIRYIRKGYKPIELPISYNARSYEEGKHIELFKTPIEGLRALWKSRVVAKVYDYGDE